MSLFKVCTWWTAQCPDYEANYDTQLLHCCRFGNDDHEKDYIIVASHAGYLSVFQPNALMPDQIDEEEEPASGFKPTDQLLEMKLSSPIIQLSSGKFQIGASNEGKRQLVVLHPMKLSVYSLHTTEGLAEHGIQFKLNVCFEHKLKEPAYSVCNGFFGGYRSREFFCVTSMNSTLTFLEQDGISYETTLTGERNIPSLMIYNSRLDNFLIISPHSELECYRYQDLSQTLEAQKKKAIQPIWSVCIGEFPLNMQIQQIAENENIVLILCENLLYGISDESQVKFIKRLDYSPTCFCSFVAGWYYEPDARLIITIVSDSGTLLIYNMTHLIWAAQLADVPVSICRSNLNGLAGAICSLSENGKIDVSYLGSDPQEFQVPPLNLQKINFEKTQNELIELEKEIKQGIDFTDMSMINATTERDLNVELTISPTLELCKYGTQIPPLAVSTDEIKMVLVSVSLKANANLEQIQVQFYCSLPLKMNKGMHSFQQMTTDQKEHLDYWFYMDKNIDIETTTISVIVSFINKQSIPRVIEKSKSLPLAMFYKLCQPQKEGAYKLTISVNRTVAPTIDQLFTQDFPIESTHNAAGFKSIYNGKIVTIVAGKHSNRYRIHSDHFPAISPVLEALLQRIESFDQTKIKITSTPPLPINAIASLVEAHLKAYLEVQQIREKLRLCTIRMRLLERRYFTKLDDKKSSTIDSILLFLKSTHQELITLIQSLEKAKENLSKMQCELSCGLATLTHLIKLFDLPAKTCDNLCSALLSTVCDYPQQSWEEMTAAGLNILNYLGPLRKNKTLTNDDELSFDKTPFEFERFKRHLTGLLERLSRMVTHTGDHKSTDSDDLFQEHETLHEEDDAIENDDSSAPPKEEESDWIFDVKQTMEVLPRLQNAVTDFTSSGRKNDD